MSMNFAYLAGFEAIQFVDRPFPKTIDIFVCEMNVQGVILYKTSFTKHSILYITFFTESEHTIRNLIPSFHSLR